jgi:hypothetical protein
MDLSISLLFEVLSWSPGPVFGVRIIVIASCCHFMVHTIAHISHLLNLRSRRIIRLKVDEIWDLSGPLGALIVGLIPYIHETKSTETGGIMM